MPTFKEQVYYHPKQLHPHIYTTFARRQSNTDHTLVWFTLVPSVYSQFHLFAIYRHIHMFQITVKQFTKFQLLSQHCVNSHSLVKPSLLCRNSTIPCTNCPFSGFSIYYYSHTTFIRRFFCKEMRRFYLFKIYFLCTWLYKSILLTLNLHCKAQLFILKLLWFLLWLNQTLVTDFFTINRCCDRWK